ncbi:MAG: era [Haloplasmataceae bacterium]|jgi:GTP-binding protein Era|nr:era [Haloplasmataceae bacterium]
MEEKFKSGFITIVGRPNAGKSTFINQVLKQKIAIVSDKPQTTRNKIQAVYTTSDAQIIFIDTPGVHKPKHKLGEFMNKVALNAMKQVDIVLFMIDGSESLSTGNRFIMETFKHTNQPVFLIINKIDIMKKENILATMDEYQKEFEFAEIIPISALTNNNVDHLVDTLKKYLPVGPQYYPSDIITDHPEKFVISELIREKVLIKTREEIPHSVAVVIDEVKKRDDAEVIDVFATIIIERDSQKRIIIGKGGQMLKDVGTLARRDIQNLLGSKVYLELWVKVVEDWRNKRSSLHDFGYRENDY